MGMARIIWLLSSLPRAGSEALPRLIPVIAQTALCGDAHLFSQQLTAAIEQRLPLTASDALPTVTLRKEEVLTADVWFSQSAQPRHLRSGQDDCGVLARSIIIVIATALENDRLRATVLHATKANEAPSVTRTPTKMRVGAGADVALGVTPQAAFGMRGTVAIEKSAFAVELSFQWLQSTVFTQLTKQLDASVFNGQATGCYQHLWFFGCGVLAAGVMRTRLLGLSTTASSPWVGTAARVGYRFTPNPTWQLRLFAELWVPITYTTLSLDSRSVWRSAPIAGSAGLAIDFLHGL